MITTLIAAILKAPGLTSIIGSVAESGIKRFSKTKVGAAGLLAVGPDWGSLIAGVIQGDPASIGNIVLIAGAWAFALFGRGNQDKKG